MEDKENASPIIINVMEIGIVQEVKTREEEFVVSWNTVYEPKKSYFHSYKSHYNLLIRIIASFSTIYS